MSNRTCSVPECEKAYVARGYCKTHYYAKRASGELVIPGTKLCSVPECEKPAESRGLCKPHVSRLRKYGTTDGPLPGSRSVPNRQPQTCKADGCESRGSAWGYCAKHYQRVRKYGTTELPKRETKRCSVEGCDRKYRCSGYCSMHYSRFIAKGDPGPVGMLQAIQGLGCEIEGCDGGAKFFGLCGTHHRRKRTLEEVATNPNRRINSWATTPERLRRVGWTERVVRPDLGPCWEWNGLKDRKGYGRIALKGRVMRAAHRVAFEEWVRPLAADEEACHKCDNPPCMNPAHLFPGSRLDNMRDAMSKNRHAHGERAGQHKLTEQQVMEIRAAYVPRKVTQAYLADVYGVSQSAIGYILRGRNWKHLPMP